MKLRLTLAAALLVIAAAASWAAPKPKPMDVLIRAMSLHRGVRDYTATVRIHAEIPDLDMPDRTAKVYVKPPDKVYVESRGQFVFIPKRALLFGDVARDIGRQASVSIIGAKRRGADTLYTLKIIPKAPPSGGPAGAPANSRVLMVVNASRWTMEQILLMDGPKQLASVAFTYSLVQGFWMPTRVSATIPNVPNSSKPGRFAISFSDYRINTGLTDQFFAEKEKHSPVRPRRLHHPGPPG